MQEVQVVTMAEAEASGAQMAVVETTEVVTAGCEAAERAAPVVVPQVQCKEGAKVEVRQGMAPMAVRSAAVACEADSKAEIQEGLVEEMKVAQAGQVVVKGRAAVVARSLSFQSSVTPQETARPTGGRRCTPQIAVRTCHSRGL